jgi:hypothetical protein
MCSFKNGPYVALAKISSRFAKWLVQKSKLPKKSTAFSQPAAFNGEYVEWLRCQPLKVKHLDFLGSL